MTGPVSPLLAERFRLGEVLGQGAETAIYRAKDEATGRPVAIKLALTEFAATGLRREFDTLQSLRHPNLPEVHFLGGRVGAARAFLARELVEGEPLDDFARGASDLEALAVLWQLARVLAFLHRQGFVHGDVKPANVLVKSLPQRGPWATLIDLGFSGTEQTCQGEVFRGTPFYSPIRLLEGTSRRAVDDVFALGRTFLELRRPADWHASLAQLLLRSCSEDPDLRPSDGQAFLVAFESLGLLQLPDSSGTEPAPFVGRKAELQQLRQLVADKSVGLLSIEGEAGIGKSALLRVFGTGLVAEGKLVLSYSCGQVMRDPSEGLARLLAFSPGIALGERDELLRLTGDVQEAGAADPSAESVASSAHRLSSAMGRFLMQLGRRGSVVVLLDDIRLDTLDQQGPLAKLLRRVSRAPGIPGVTVVLATRTGVGLAQSGARAQCLQLGELERGDALRLAQHLLASKHRLLRAWTGEIGDLAQRIVQAAGGHPGYQESVQRSLISHRHGKGADAVMALDVCVPGSFAEAIDARLDALFMDATELLEVLSVLDEPTEVAILVKLVDLSDARRRAALDELIRGGMLEYDRGAGGLGTESDDGKREGFSVTSRIVASRMRERMGMQRVEQSHAQAVAILSGVTAGEDYLNHDVAFHALASRKPELIAEFTPGEVHRLLSCGLPCRAAEIAERALETLGQAVPSGEQSEVAANLERARRQLRLLMADAQLAAGEFKGALASYRLAEELSLDSADFVHVRRKQSGCLATLGDHGGAEECLREIDSRILADISPRSRALLACSLARLAFRRGQPADAERILRSGLEIIQSEEPDEVAAELCNNLGVVAFDTARVREAEGWHLRALKARESLGDTRGVSISLGNLAGISHYRGELGAAQLGFERSLELKRRLGEPAAVGLCLSNLGLVAQGMGDFERALSLHEEALHLREEIGDERGRARSLEKLAQLLGLKGCLQRAADLAQTSIEVATANGERDTGLAAALLTRTEIAIETGRFDVAQAMIERGQELCREVGLPSESYLFEVRKAQCDLLHQPGEPMNSRRLSESIASLREAGDKVAVATALSIQAELQLDHAEHDAALSSAQELLSLGQRSHNSVHIALGRYVIGVVKDKQGLDTQASEMLHLARKEAERMGLPLLLWSVQAALASYHEHRGRLERASNWSLACVASLRTVLDQVRAGQDEIAFMAQPRRARILRMLTRHAKGSFSWMASSATMDRSQP